MKYLIIGAGGTGGVVGFHMAQAGKDVTLIARDAHLESIQQKGLTLQTMWDELANRGSAFCISKLK